MMLDDLLVRLLGRLFTAAILVIAFSNSAWADWSLAGAQYSCSAESATFTLLPYDKTSFDPNPPLEPGFTALPDGETNVKCRLGKRKLQTQIDITPPQARGMCMGGGSVYVSSMVVDGVELLKQGMQFNWACDGNARPIVKIQLQNAGSLMKLEQCAVEVSSNDDAPKCFSKSFDVDAIAAANAKVDHQLADKNTQEAKSAKLLPPENDLAQVFGFYPADSSVPLCAHWSSIFPDADFHPERQRHGRIAGSKGDQVYLHRANPQLCKSRDDDGCTPKSYLIPGDRVDVGFICGDWTFVQYQSRIRSKPHIRGWVKTSHLYDVDPVPDVTMQRAPVSTEHAHGNPLVQAVADQNINEVKRLIAAGANANGLANSGEPLTQAVETGDIELVRLLIKLGADININNFNRCRILSCNMSQKVFDLLVEAGIDLNAPCRKQSQTQLMDLAYYNRLWAWDRIHDRDDPSKERLLDPVKLAKRLLAAGADPNAKDNSGQTALFYAMSANNIDVAKLLLDEGADPNIAIDEKYYDDSTPLMRAFSGYSRSLDPSMFELLLSYGANPDYRNSAYYNEYGIATFAGQTVLTRAAQDGYYTLAQIALEHGADTTIPRNDGKLPAKIAIEHKHPKIAELIKKHAKKRALKKSSDH